ncbi:MAG: hypothetical protein GXY82_02045 [Methanospirillum sp.]|nr:hypothetical protein [Methanospirillum sp.]
MTLPRTHMTLTSGNLALLDPKNPEDDPVVPLVVVSGRPVDLPHGVVYVLREDLPLVEELQHVFRVPDADFNTWYDLERELYEAHGLVYGENDELDLLVRLLEERGLWHCRAPRYLFLV